jgi:corrinoid protein of di/trimethylamine methyltransferase
MAKKEILENLATAIIEGNGDMVKEIVQNALDVGIAPLEAVDQGLSKGMAVVGAQFERREAYLPELIMAANTFGIAMEILKPAIEAKKQELSKEGTIVISTVKGDHHNIGKDIVATVLETNGFEVVDVGIDQPTMNIIDAAEKNKADIIALSSLMTTTMPYQKEVIDALGQMKIRDKYIVLVGGGPVTQKWADQIGADGYGKTAVAAVETARNLMKERRIALE